MASTVFLEFASGDRAAHTAATAAHERAGAFYAACGAQLGLAGPLAALSDDDAALLADMYAADPTWAARGPLLVRAPAPLTLGRVTLELDPESPKTTENFVKLCTGELGLGQGWFGLLFLNVPL